MMNFADPQLLPQAAGATRRGLLSVLGGIFAILPFSLEDNADARKGKGRKKHKKHNKRKKRKNRKPPVETRVDATCPEPADFSCRIPEGNNRFAQTFTAKASGPLVSAELELSKNAGSSGDFILRVSPLDGSGTPTNEVLAEATVADADVPDGGSIVPFSFADPFAVKSGAEYALVLTRGAGVFGWSGRNGDACAGAAFQSLDQMAPFTEGACGGGTDFIFTAFVTS